MQASKSAILSLDDLYKMTAFIYGDRNSARPRELTFAHFVEVCGALTVYDRKKRRENIDFVDALCKSLGWYFPLLAKLNVKSVESLVFRKFPNVCPYCRQRPHQEIICKQVKGTRETVNHEDVNSVFQREWENRPQGLNDWQKMFADIYPRTVNENGRSTLGLFEEIGELAESIRVFDVHPHYFLGEAADIFSYLMGLANEHAIREEQEGRVFSFEKEYLIRYPGLCTQCGSKICSCPAIPASTVGRMAKELLIRADEDLFISSLPSFVEEGSSAAQAVLESMGGYPGLLANLPFDRGDTNHGLIQVCLRIAAVVEVSSPELATALRAEAIKLGDSTKQAGTAHESMPVTELMSRLRMAWKDLDEENRAAIKEATGLAGDIAEIFDVVRILFVSCNPKSAMGSLKIDSEIRAVKDCLSRTKHGHKITIESLPAATVHDIRRALLDNEYDIVHFSGHSDQDNLIFENESGEAVMVPIGALATLMAQYPTVRCVVLNACESVKAMTTPISPLTIGMDESIPDEAAIAFSKGFYDALAAGKDFERAYKEGRSAVELSNFDSNYIKAIPAAKSI